MPAKRATVKTEVPLTEKNSALECFEAWATNIFEGKVTLLAVHWCRLLSYNGSVFTAYFVCPDPYDV